MESGGFAAILRETFGESHLRLGEAIGGYDGNVISTHFRTEFLEFAAHPRGDFLAAENQAFQVFPARSCNGAFL